MNKTINAMATQQHSRNGLGPSGSSRWLQCTASVRLTRDAKRTTNPAAELGTSVHELGEICLLEGGTAFDFIGKTIYGHTVTDKMAEDAQFYVDYVRSFLNETSELFVESKLNLEMVAEGTFGSSDAIVIADPVLHVFDYKNGRGHVDPFENTQGQLYALGAYHEHNLFYEFEKVVIHIVQPNSSQGSHASSWETSVDDLLAFGEYAKERAAMALSDDSPCEPSESACQWCEYSAQCRALHDFTTKLVTDEFQTFEEVDATAITLDEVAHILKHKKMIEDTLKKYESRVLDTLEAGEKVDGFKLVKKQVRKKWVNELDAYDKLITWFKQDEFTTRKMATPTQVDKLLGKDVSTRKANVFKTLWDLPEASNTIAPMSDRRKEVEPLMADFKEI